MKIYSYQYRIQHESIPLTEEKQLLKEIRLLEGTRDKVIANEAMRAKIKESMGQKDDIQGQVKVRESVVRVLWLLAVLVLWEFVSYALFVMCFAVNGCWFGWSEEGEASNFSKD